MTRAVSGPTSASTCSPSIRITVRQTPLTARLSPSFSSGASGVWMRTRKPPPVPLTSASVPTASTMPVNIRLHPASGPSCSTVDGNQLATSARRCRRRTSRRPRRAPSAPRSRARDRSTPACQAAACIAAPPSSSSVEMSNGTSARRSSRRSPDPSISVAPGARQCLRLFRVAGRPRPPLSVL